MRKIIDGKVYDTETAECLGSDHYSHTGDFRHWEESLYRTKRGAFFVAGSGGPMSRYSTAIDQNSWSGGSDLKVVSEAEAREWLESHGDAEEYEYAFAVEEA